MKTGTRVSTEFGLGKIVYNKMNSDIIKRWCVKLDNCPDSLLYLQKKQGGLYFWKNEIKINPKEYKQVDLFGGDSCS